jgi:hypothetical protein
MNVTITNPKTGSVLTLRGALDQFGNEAPEYAGHVLISQNNGEPVAYSYDKARAAIESARKAGMIVVEG